MEGNEVGSRYPDVSDLLNVRTRNLSGGRESRITSKTNARASTVKLPLPIGSSTETEDRVLCSNWV